MTERPSGITIIAGLQIIGAIVAILMVIGPLSDYIFFENTLINELYKIFLIIMVVISLIVAYGLLKGMKWAWSVTIIFQIIYIGINAINLNIFSLVIGLLIIYYLTRPYVKTYFEKSV
jgi:hypothetical protein